jgi:hypothetical protein
MKKTLTSIFAPALAVIAMFVATPASADLLTNPGFENAPFTGAEQPGAGTGWTSFNGAFRIQGQPPLGPAGAHGGTVALKVFGVAGAFQQFAASEGQTWNGGAWVINDSLDPMAGGQVAAVNIEWIDANNNQIGFISNGTFNLVNGDAATQDVWRLKTITGVAPAGTAFARLVLITGDFQPGGFGGAPRFDDAFFEVIPEPSSIALLSLGAIGLVARRRRS